jgi:hypothetical protein
MKRVIAMAFCLAGLIVAGHASAQEPAVKADVPFDFTAGGKLLPSGTYVITSDITMPNVIHIRNLQHNVTAFSGVNYSGKESKTGKLIFERYGNQYFLKEILCSAAPMNVELPTSKQEKEIRTQEAKLRKSDQVLVASK